MDFIIRRFPDRRDSTLVFSAVVFVVFTWAIRGFIYKVPAFILYFELWDVFGILAQLLTFALLESLLVTGLLVGLSALLPGKWLRTGFAWKGFITVLAAALVSLYLKDGMTNQPTMNFLLITLIVSSVTWLGLILAAHFWLFFRRLLLNLADRLSIFLYVFIPLGLVSVSVVIIRILW